MARPGPWGWKEGHTETALSRHHRRFQTFLQDTRQSLFDPRNDSHVFSQVQEEREESRVVRYLDVLGTNELFRRCGSQLGVKRRPFRSLVMKIGGL